MEAPEKCCICLDVVPVSSAMEVPGKCMHLFRRRSGVFVINFEQISNTALVFQFGVSNGVSNFPVD